jgi:hypothetical protein
MATPKGHECGHSGLQAPVGFTWADYVEMLADEVGGMAELARRFQERAPRSARIADDPMTVQRGLRRLTKRGNQEGDKYGRLLVRLFGMPELISSWARLMGQYHSRFADLPVPIRRDQLRRWDRPPVSESPLAVWVHVGFASLAHRDRDLEQAGQRLGLARLVRGTDVAAQLEVALFGARLASDRGMVSDERARVREARHLLAGTRAGLDPDEISDHDKACYFARIQDQEAYRISRVWRGEPGCLEQALAMYEAIPTGGPPFAGFRREHGRAWCHWRLGNVALAERLERLAVAHAGDGGLVRLRVQALKLLANILGPVEESRAILDRASGLAKSLQDEDLLAGLEKHGQSILNASAP